MSELQEQIERIAAKMNITAPPVGYGAEDLPNDCPTCGGLGFYVPDAAPGQPGFGRATKCYCFRQGVDIAKLLRHSGLEPSEYGWPLDYAAGRLGKSEAIQKAQSIVEKSPPVGWLTLYGAYGVGKSGLLKAAVADACKRGITAHYCRAAQILDDCKAHFTSEGSEIERHERETKERYGRYQLLAIDEVDRVSLTDYAQSVIFHVLDIRYNKRDTTATLMATNAMPGRMGSVWGYLESRTADGERTVMAGDDMRKSK